MLVQCFYRKALKTDRFLTGGEIRCCYMQEYELNCGNLSHIFFASENYPSKVLFFVSS